MLIGTLSDSHLRTSTPACRKDKDFYATQFRKLYQVEKILRQYNVRHLLHGGDLFDDHNPSHRLVYDVMTFLNYSSSRWLVNPGNHDMFGANTSTLSRSGLGILYQAGLIDLVAKPEDLTIHDGDESVLVRSVPYSLLDDPRIYDFSMYEGPCILLPHEMLTTHFVPYPHKLISDIKTDADVVIGSHWHGQFNLKIGSTCFINSGPLTRQTTFESRLQPAVGMIEVTSTEIRTFLIPLEVEPAALVIDLSTKDEAAHQGVAEQFLSTLKASAVEAIDRHQLVRMVGEQHKFSEQTIQSGITRLVETEANLQLT